MNNLMLLNNWHRNLQAIICSCRFLLNLHGTGRDITWCQSWIFLPTTPSQLNVRLWCSRCSGCSRCSRMHLSCWQSCRLLRFKTSICPCWLDLLGCVIRISWDKFVRCKSTVVQTEKVAVRCKRNSVQTVLRTYVYLMSTQSVNA